MTSKPAISLSEHHRLAFASSSDDFYKRQLEVVCNNATLALFIMDEHQRCTYMNPAAETLTGYHLAETQGRTLHDVIHHTRPDGSAYPLCECPIDQAFPKKSREQGEEVFVHKDGHFYPVAYTASPIREGDRVIGTIIEVRDLTHEKLDEQARQVNAQRVQVLQLEATAEQSTRKQTEEALRASEADFRAMFNVTSVGMAQLDTQTRQFLRVNAAFCAITGYSETELLTLTVDDINHPDDRNFDRESFITLLQGEATSYQSEKRYCRKDGRVVWVLATGNIIRDEAGCPLRAVAVIQDITDRKRIEANLRASEERFRFVTEAVNGLIFDWDLRKDEVYRSKKLYDLIGVYPEDAPLTADWWRGRCHPEDLARLQPQIIELLTSSKSIYESEYRVRHEAGHWVDVWEQSCLIRDAQGQVVRIVGCTVDISDRKQAEAALRRSEEQFRISQELSLDAFTILDSVRDETGAIVDFIWKYVNPKAGEILQHSPSELIGQHLLKVLPGNQLNSNLFARYVQVVETGQSHDIELSYEADGITGWFRNMAVKLDDGVAIFFSNITDRKQAEANLRESERRFRRLVESNIFGVAFGDFSGGIHYVNDYFLNMVGYTRAELEAGQIQWIDITPPEFLPLDEIAAVELRTKGVSTPFEKEYIRKDGSRVPILIGAALLQEPYDQQQDIVTFYIDLTERKQVEAEREKLLQQAQTAREEAETANRIKDEFLAVLSHELRSPLNPILGWASLLQTRHFDEQGMKRGLQTIERNAKLQTRLIEDLLDVSRILRGKMVLNICPVNLVTVIESAQETIRLAAEAKAIDVKFKLSSPKLDLETGLDQKPKDQNSEFMVLGDSARLQQIVWNLLSNAVKFTPDGGRVEVKLEAVRGRKIEGTAQEGEKVGTWENPVAFSPPPTSSPPPFYAQITVSDTGKGISPEFLPYVFDYFCQEDGKITRKFGGLGLGLAIVRHLAELHGGMVQVESAGEGQGSLFRVCLPLILQPLASGKTPSIAALSTDLSPFKILVVDDDEDMQLLMQAVLEQEGAQVLVATTAIAALQLFDQQPPDLLISDIGMPEIDGYALMHQIRQRSPQQGGLIPAIALTAYASEYDQQQALKVGFQQHLAKPVDPETLVQAIVNLLAGNKEE